MLEEENPTDSVTCPSCHQKTDVRGSQITDHLYEYQCIPCGIMFVASSVEVPEPIEPPSLPHYSNYAGILTQIANALGRIADALEEMADIDLGLAVPPLSAKPPKPKLIAEGDFVEINGEYHKIVKMEEYTHPHPPLGPGALPSSGALPSLGQDQKTASESVQRMFNFDGEKKHLKDPDPVKK